MLDNFDWTNLGTNGGLFGAVIAYIWRTTSSMDDKVTALELKVAENYVTKPELQRVEDKIDTMGNKIDTVNNNILLLLTKGRD